MAEYLPPTENLPIFDTTVFNAGDEPLTYNTASKHFLKYPSAQGTENLQAINVNGTSQFNADINIGSGSTGNLVPNVRTYKTNIIVGTGGNGQMDIECPLIIGGFGSITTTTNNITMQQTSIINQTGTKTSPNVLDSTNIKNGSNIKYLSDNTQQTSAYTGAGALAGSYTNTNMTIDTNGKITAIASGTGAPSTYTFTAFGTYVQPVPVGSKHLKAIIVGAGGGGGGGAGTAKTGLKGASGSGGGGGGGVTIVDCELTTETSFTCFVGTGGAGGANGLYPNDGSVGGAGGASYIQSNTGVYYGRALGGGGGAGALNNLSAGVNTQPIGGAGGAGSQGVGGAGGYGVGMGTPTAPDTGFIFTNIIGNQSALIGCGGGGGGGAVYTNGSGVGAVWFDSKGGDGGALGYTLSQGILQGYGNGGTVAVRVNPTTGTGILGFGGGGGGGGEGSRFAGTGTPASSGAVGIYGSGGGGGGSDNITGATGGNGGDGVIVLFFS